MNNIQFYSIIMVFIIVGSYLLIGLIKGYYSGYRDNRDIKTSTSEEMAGVIASLRYEGHLEPYIIIYVYVKTNNTIYGIKIENDFELLNKGDNVLIRVITGGVYKKFLKAEFIRKNESNS